MSVFTFGNMGWTCPGCSRCYSPSTVMCIYCPVTPVITTTTEPYSPVTITPAPMPNPADLNVPEVTWTPLTPPGSTGVYPLTVGDNGVIPLTVGDPTPKVGWGG